ncbi:metal ABC transporter substrate-binding protein [Streptomyces sp. NPDC006923]|uniref:metal ABC transporter substrate-binding protein n=1 Tax=Streptomyces sp. NPDC006923 TaxID=3155355 RepID=UPI0033F627F2
MNVRRLIPTAAMAGAVTLGLVSLSACSSDAADGGDSKGGEKLGITASFYPLQYLATEIGGDHVSVTTLTPPGVEPHDLELKPRDVARLGDAGVILYLKGIAPAVDDAVAQSGGANIVDAGSLTTLEKHGTEAGVHEETHEAEAEEATPDGNDPHIWLDPVRFAEVARGVGASMEKADPDHAADYKKNTDALVKKLGGLDTAFKQGLANTTGKTFITTHAAFGYLAERYGLEQEAIVGMDPEAEPSPARVRDLGAVAKREKVSTVFFETLTSDKTAKTIAADAGLKTDVLDPIEGITDRSKGRDYIEVMESNLTALQKALGAK